LYLKTIVRVTVRRTQLRKREKTLCPRYNFLVKRRRKNSEEMKFSKKMRSKRQKEYEMEEEVAIITSRKTSSGEDSKD
jgi:hypothetical protein